MKRPFFLDSPAASQNNRKAVLTIYVLTTAGIVLWLAVIFLAPYLRSRSPGWSMFIYRLFSPLCHQAPSRSFSCFGHPLAVCARCLGIYSGFLSGALLFPLLADFSRAPLPKNKYFLILTIPIGIDTLGNFFQLWVTQPWLRFGFGFLWGILLPFYLIKGLSDIFIRKRCLKISD
jgi:uncharacterized membrane protein